MGKAHQMYKVELYIEVPESVSSPDRWDWAQMLNGDVPLEKITPLRYKIVQQIQEGNA